MLERRTITRDSLDALLRLDVRDDQRGLVASNAVTLAEAPFEPGSQVWGLWDGDRAVGLMAMVHPDLYPYHEPGDDRQAAYLWRLMIDRDQQGRGHGRAAIAEALQQTRDWGLPRLACSVANVAHSNLGFYLRQGFRDTGRIVEDERVLTIDA